MLLSPAIFSKKPLSAVIPPTYAKMPTTVHCGFIAASD